MPKQNSKPRKTTLSISIETSTAEEDRTVDEIFGNAIAQLLLLAEKRRPGSAKRALAQMKRQFNAGKRPLKVSG
jgi:hypothetical protein